MRISILQRIYVCLAFIIVVSTAQAQITQVNDTTSTPIPGVGHDYIHLLNETVNPANGSVSVQIQIPTPKGRGLSLPFSLNYSSNGVNFLNGAGTNYPFWEENFTSFSQGGWGYGVPYATSSEWTLTLNNLNGGPNTLCEYAANYIFQDASGARHDLGIGTMARLAGNLGCPDGGNSAQGGDAWVSAKMTCGGCVPPNLGEFVVSDQEGNIYSFPGGDAGPLGELPATITDHNGNEVTSGYSGNNASFTDTLGRTVASFPMMKATSHTDNLDNCQPNLPGYLECCRCKLFSAVYFIGWKLLYPASSSQ